MIRFGVCGVAFVVRMVQADKNMGANYINGFDGLTGSGRFYLCIVACSAAPPEAVLIKLKKDDRFLRFAVEMRLGMEFHLE